METPRQNETNDSFITPELTVEIIPFVHVMVKQMPIQK
jgi:hypothetical protein